MVRFVKGPERSIDFALQPPAHLEIKEQVSHLVDKKEISFKSAERKQREVELSKEC